MKNVKLLAIILASMVLSVVADGDPQGGGAGGTIPSVPDNEGTNPTTTAPSEAPRPTDGGDANENSKADADADSGGTGDGGDNQAASGR